MTHPKARTKPRPRSTSDTNPPYRLTAKGRAMLWAHDEARAWALIDKNQRARKQHDQDRVTPCAPQRGNSAPAALPAHDAGTAAAPPAHPAGKSDAALIVKNHE